MNVNKVQHDYIHVTSVQLQFLSFKYNINNLIVHKVTLLISNTIIHTSCVNV